MRLSSLTIHSAILAVADDFASISAASSSRKSIENCGLIW
jgi:hypothetical protein